MAYTLQYHEESGNVTSAEAAKIISHLTTWQEQDTNPSDGTKTTPSPSVSAGGTSVSVGTDTASATTPAPTISAGGISVSVGAETATATTPSPSVTGAGAASVAVGVDVTSATTPGPTVPGAGVVSVGLGVDTATTTTPSPSVTTGGVVVSLGVNTVSAATPAPTPTGAGVATAGLGVDPVSAVTPAPTLFGGEPATQVLRRILRVPSPTTHSLDLNMPHQIDPPDRYLAGESLVQEFTVQQDGVDFDVSGATISWSLLPVGADDVADAVLSDTDGGVSVTVSDPDNDGVAERITVEIDQTVTAGLAGYYTQVVEIDDPGDGLTRRSGPFPIDEL